MNEDRRLIEDYLPIEAISKEASREKSVRKGHISTLHLWWARRPLVACRAAVYGALVPASQFVPENGPDNKKQSLGRANAAKFVTELCKYPGSPRVIQKAQEHILQAHAVRLSAELAEAKKTNKWPRWVEEFKWPKDTAQVTREDIETGRAPRPRVLDMFAGGGAIPLEALRLGCEAYALDLNPVAHIIELCTLVYPQKYGKPDPNARGMAGPKNENGETTWGGLANEVRYWGNWILDKVKAEIGDLYPLIPDPEAKEEEIDPDSQKVMEFAKDAQGKLRVKKGYLIPVAYLWTRTVTCKNPACGATVPLVRQTWLCKKKGRYVALKMVAPRGKKQVRFEVLEASSEDGLGFDPAGFSKGGNATCPFCGTVADNDYVKGEGCAGRMGLQMMAIACTRCRKQGKVYLSSDNYTEFQPDDAAIQRRIDVLCKRTGLTIPDEPVPSLDSFTCKTHLYGLRTWGDLFTTRQLLCLLTFAAAVRQGEVAIRKYLTSEEQVRGIVSFLTAVLDRLVDFNSSLCVFNYTGGRGVVHTFGRQALPMVWDFAETNPFNSEGASWVSGIEDLPAGLRDSTFGLAAEVKRGSATALSWHNATFDAVITDPPYYDNISYSNLSDFFYVWIKRTVGHIWSEHFAAALAPKKNEAVAESARYGGSKAIARHAYQQMMAQSFAEAYRVLRPGGQITVVYAHKTTVGWSTLVDALRDAGFTVMEAWPVNTEKTGRLLAQNAAALASSIFIVARKYDAEAGSGSYDTDVRPQLEQIVRERVETLWAMGVSGADLVIACVGAGLRAFTRYERVEYANGEEVPAEKFLAEVETVVLETILARLSKEVGGNGGQYSLVGLDPATRFYILWRYTYRSAELDAGEAIIFANGTHVELDGAGSLSYGARALIEKKKSKYRLLDFKDRGNDDKLGLPEDGQSASLIDALHRTLWLMENRPTQLADFLQKSQVNREQMRLVAQALAGPALKGGELMDVSPSSELAALGKLTANWRSVVEDGALTPLERADRKKGQMQIEYSED
jgi:putative DNA methylase